MMGSRKEKRDRRRKLGLGMTPSQRLRKKLTKESKEFEENRTKSSV